MSSMFKKTGIPDAKVRELSALLFVKLAEEKMLDDVTISEHSHLFTQWTENWTGAAGLIVTEGGKIYRSLTGKPTKPSENPTDWEMIADLQEEYPEWSRPIGVMDAYSAGSKVTHGEKRWVSDANGNVDEPGVHGWTEVTE